MKTLIKLLFWSMSGLLLATSQANANNLVANGSFEVGLKGLSYSTIQTGPNKYALSDLAIKPELDLTTSAAGNASVRIIIPGAVFPTNLHRLKFSFMSGIMEVKPDTTYTLSFYAKSDQPAGLVTYINDGFKIYTPFANQYYNLTTGWKRYSVSGKTIGKYAWVSFVYERKPDTNAVALWLDGVQLEEGEKPSDFTMATPVEVGCDSSQPHNLYLPGDTVDARIYFSRSAGQTADVDVAYVTEEALTGKIIAQARNRLSFKEGENRITTAAPYQLPTDRLGVFKTTVSVLNPDGKALDLDDYIYGVFQPLPPITQYKEDSIFAVDHLIGQGWCHAGRDSSDAYFKMASEIGIRWFRDLQFPFNDVCPEPGVFRYPDISNSLFKVADKYKIGPMATLGIELVKTYIPAWARSNVYTKRPDRYDERGQLLAQYKNEDSLTLNPEAWHTYVFETVKRYKDYVHYWEVFNEQYSFPEYPEYLRITYKAIKLADPNAAVLMNICAGPEEGLFKKRCLAEKEYDNFDILSMHLYQSPDYTTPPDLCVPAYGKIIDELRATLKECRAEKPIWDTEGGYGAESYYTKRKAPSSYLAECRKKAHNYLNVYFLDTVPVRNQQLLQASYNIRKYIVYMHHNVKKYFYFVFQDIASLTPPAGLSMALLDIDDTPRLSYIAYGQMVRMLEDAVPIKELALTDKMHGYLFSKGQSRIATLWNTVDRDAEYHVTLNAGELKVFDLVGNEVLLKSEHETTILPISAAPIYVVTDQNSEQAVVRVLEMGKTVGLEDKVIKLAVQLAREPKSKKPAVAVLVKNNTVKEFSGEMRLVGYPPDWKPARDTISIKGVAPLKEKIEWVPFAAVKAQEEPVGLRVGCMSEDPMIIAGVEFPKVAFCHGILSNIRIDGVVGDAEWKKSSVMKIDRKKQVIVEVDEDTRIARADEEPMSWQGPDDLSATVHTAWGKDDFYVGVKVKCREFIQNKTDASKIFNSTSVELFLSLEPLNNAYDSGYKSSDYQLLFAPMTHENQKYYYLVTRGEKKEPVSFQGVEMASRQVPGGYEMEIKIPFNNFDELKEVKDKEGLGCGFDVAINGVGKKGFRKYQMAWAGNSRNNSNVNKFGRLIFAKTDEVNITYILERIREWWQEKKRKN